MQPPFISICIPAYKNSVFLERLLRSIAAQSYTGFEVILTDDSPDDSVAALVRDYEQQLPLAYFKNNPAAGMPQNWNECLQKARGEWIKLVHDDDWFTDAESLQRFASAAANHPSCAFIFSACNNVELKTGKLEKQLLTHDQRVALEKSANNLIYHNVIGHPSVVMHRKSDLRYDTGFRWLVDIDFYMRYLQQQPAWHYIDTPCVNIGQAPEQLSAQYYKNAAVEIPEYFSLAAKHGLRLRSKHVFGAFWLLVRKFKLKEVAQIRAAGYSGDLPAGLEKMMAYQARIPRLILKQTPYSQFFMNRCYRQLFPA